MRAISHILRSVGYVTLLPYLASASSESFATCMRNPDAQFTGVLLTAITFLFILGYGNILVKKLRGSAVGFWVANILFHAVCACLAIGGSRGNLFSSIRMNLLNVHDVFIPEYQPYLALSAVGGLSFVTLTVWMPVAAVLSMIALAKTLSNARNAPM